MTNSRLAVSTGIGGVALVLALINDLGLASGLGINPKITGILALVLATLAFIISIRQASPILSGFLIIQGLSDTSAALIADAMIGVPFGAWVFALGIVKSAITISSMAKREKQTQGTKNATLQTS